MKLSFLALLVLIPTYGIASLNFEVEEPIQSLSVSTKDIASIEYTDKWNSEKLDLKVDGYHFFRCFFAWGIDQEGQEVDFHFDRKVSFSLNTEYGWMMSVSSKKQLVKIKEVLTLPSPSATWNVGKETVLKENGRIAETTKYYSLHEGLIYNAWTISEGDPKGRYNIELFYEDQLIYEVSFDVE